MGKYRKIVREFFFKWEVWQGRTKNPQKQNYNHYIETTYPRERYQMDFVQWSDYLWESDKKELLNEELKIEKARREISGEEIESKFKDKKMGKIREPIFLKIIDHFSKYGYIEFLIKLWIPFSLKSSKILLNLCLPRFCILIRELNLRIS